jgi:predicted dehydrogenase
MDQNMILKKNINRRRFLQKTLTAGAVSVGFPYLIPSSAMGFAGNVAPSERVTLGVIGTGNQGFQDMRGFLRKDDLQIIAVCDVNKGSHGYKTRDQYMGREPARKLVNDYYAGNKRSGKHQACDAYADFRDLLARDDIDAVLHALPDHWHAPVTILAAQAGKDIYGEKPFSLTIAEGQAMVKAVRKYGVVFQTGTHHRSVDRHLRFCCELIRNGRIGQLTKINCFLPPHGLRTNISDWQPEPVPEGFDYDMWLGPAPWAPYHPNRCLYTFRFVQDHSGGEATNTGAHKFDIIQWANDSEHTGPVEIEDQGSELPPKDSLYDTISKNGFRARYANGVELTCRAQGEPFRGSVAQFIGTEGQIDAGWSQFRTYPESLRTTVIGPNEIRLYESTDHYQNFIDCIKSRRDPIAAVEIGHRSTSVAHLANIAMLLKRKVHWDPENERFIGDDAANRMIGKSMRAPWSLEKLTSES